MVQLEKKKSNEIKPEEVIYEPVLPKWSDELLQILNKQHMLPKLPSNVTSRDVLYTFFQFYFDGTIPENTNVLDLVFTTVTLIPVMHADMNMFPECYFSNASQKPIFKVPDYKIPVPLRKFNISPLSKIGFPSWVDNPCMDQRFTKYDQDDQKAFCQEVLQHLSANTPSIEIKRAAGFLAITLLRCVIKSLHQMYFAMSKTKYNETFLGFTQLKKYCVPSDAALARLNRKMYGTKSQEAKVKFAQMFTKIVSLYVELETNHDPELHLLRAAVLCHTEYFGMETMRFVNETRALFKNSKLADSYTVDDLVSMTSFPCTLASWDLIKNFDQVHSDKPTSLFWVRLIDDNYFEELDAMNNFELCGMLSVLVNVYRGYNEKTDHSKKGVFLSNFMKVSYLRNYCLSQEKTLLEQMYRKTELVSVFAQVPQHPLAKEIVQSREFLTGNVVVPMEQLRNYKIENTVKKQWMHDWVKFKVAQMDSAILFSRGLYVKLTNGEGFPQKYICRIRSKWSNRVFYRRK